MKHLNILFNASNQLILYILFHVKHLDYHATVTAEISIIDPHVEACRMIRKFTEKATRVLIIVEKLKNGGKIMSNDMRNLKELIERYLRTLSNEDLCDGSEDLIEFIETIRDDELVRRMSEAGEIDTPPTVTGDDEVIE